MNYYIVISVSAIILAFGFGFLSYLVRDPYNDGASIGLSIAAAVLGLTALIVFVVMIAMNADYRMSSHQCRDFGEQTDRDWKMVRYNTASYDCLILTESGWVTKENVWNTEVRP